jgi:hypothetical protein
VTVLQKIRKTVSVSGSVSANGAVLFGGGLKAIYTFSNNCRLDEMEFHIPTHAGHNKCNVNLSHSAGLGYEGIILGLKSFRWN